MHQQPEQASNSLLVAAVGSDLAALAAGDDGADAVGRLHHVHALLDLPLQFPGSHRRLPLVTAFLPAPLLAAAELPHSLESRIK